MSRYLFDLDGTCIDTEDIIRQSYREAGAEPPENFLSLGSREWLELNRDGIGYLKDQAYLRRVRSWQFAFLPGWVVATMLKERGERVELLTGAPRGTVDVIAARSFSWPFATAMDGISPEGKTRFMEAWKGKGVYVDDQTYVKMPGNWRRVHYTGQSVEELFREVTA